MARVVYIDGVTWIADNTEILALVVAVAAVVASLFTVLIQRRQQRLDAFRQIHELLITPELQRGRRLVFKAMVDNQLPDSQSDDFAIMNRAIGMYDTLGTYLAKGIVPRKLVLEIWHHALREIRPGARMVAAHRAGPLPWPHLWLLLDDADKYRSKLSCCTTPAPPQRPAPVPAQPVP